MHRGLQPSVDRDAPSTGATTDDELQCIVPKRFTDPAEPATHHADQGVDDNVTTPDEFDHIVPQDPLELSARVRALEQQLQQPVVHAEAVVNDESD